MLPTLNHEASSTRHGHASTIRGCRTLDSTFIWQSQLTCKRPHDLAKSLRTCIRTKQVPCCEMLRSCGASRWAWRLSRCPWSKTCPHRKRKRSESVHVHAVSAAAFTATRCSLSLRTAWQHEAPRNVVDVAVCAHCCYCNCCWVGVRCWWFLGGVTDTCSNVATLSGISCGVLKRNMVYDPHVRRSMSCRSFNRMLRRSGRYVYQTVECPFVMRLLNRTLGDKASF